MKQSYLPYIIAGLSPLLQEDTNTNYSLHIIIGLVALAVGWAIGFFDSNRNTTKKIKQAEESAQKAIRDAEDKAAEAQKLIDTTSTSPSSNVIDNPGILRLRNENGSLSLDLDGEAIHSTPLSSDQRKRLIEILNLVRPILEGKPAPMVAPPPPSQDMLSRLDAVSTSSFAPPPTPIPIVKPSLNQIITRAPKKKDDKTEDAPTTMVGQINAILQSQMANTPLASKGISMLESPSGGVIVHVGEKNYEGIDDVPNEEIKTAIRAAIAEWEKKYTPGL